MSGRQHRALSAHGVLDMLQLCLGEPDVATYFIICGQSHDLQSAVGDWLTSEPALSDSNANPKVSQVTPQHLRSKRPSLRSLAACRSIKLAFCSSTSQLRAHALSLSMQHENISDGSSIASSRLVVINMLQLHLSTSLWSAQGLNRTLAALIDAATSMSAQLLLCEDASLAPVRLEHDLRLSSPPVEADEVAQTASMNIWDRELGIIDTHTKTFGHDNRAWAGRKVSVRQVLERWLLFDDEEER